MKLKLSGNNLNVSLTNAKLIEPIDDAEPFPADAEGVTWCRDDVGGVQVEYVRADLAGPAPIGADALRVAAYGLIEACERDWPSTPRHRAAVLKHAAALRAALASAARPPITYAPPSPNLGVAPSGPGTSAAAPKAAPAPAAVAGDPSWEALYYAWRKVGADVVGLDWGAFTHAVHYAPTTQAAPAAVAVPDGWKHDCAALLTNDVELWVDSCPHCGKPRAAAPQPPACQTCNDIGMIGGPSYYAPDEGGVPCPDCSRMTGDSDMRAGDATCGQ